MRYLIQMLLFLILLIGCAIIEQGVNEPAGTGEISSVERVVSGTEGEIVYMPIPDEYLPEEVKRAFEDKYPEYFIQTTYKGSNATYKLIITGQYTERTVYYSEAGIFLKEESIKDITDE